MVRVERFGGRGCAWIGMGAVVLAAPTGCIPSDVSDGDGVSPSVTEHASGASDAPTAADVPAPTLWAVSSPPGFEDVMPEELTGEWANVVTGPRGGVLAGRAGMEESAANEVRAASPERQMAGEDGASVDSVTDAEMASQGPREGNGPNSAISFVTADWRSSDGMMRGLSCVGSLLRPDGSVFRQRLDLRLSCLGQFVERSWESISGDIRPVIQFSGMEG